jgi:hypothetical protein
MSRALFCYRPHCEAFLRQRTQGVVDLSHAPVWIDGVTPRRATMSIYPRFRWSGVYLSTSTSSEPPTTAAKSGTKIPAALINHEKSDHIQQLPH